MKKRIGHIILLCVMLFTVIDVAIHILFFSIREDVLATFPMIGEAISEGFNVLFAFAILLILSYGYEKEKPFVHLVIASILFYVSQLHDFFDEFFILIIPSIAFEVFAFPFALIFAAIGIVKIQKYQNRLFHSNEQLKQQYREMSNTDSLSGLLNTRHFYEHVPRIIEKMHIEKKPLTLMMLDVDDFKSVNDTFGHLEGDKLIELLSALIKDEFASKYWCYRYGGEEFIVLMENVNLSSCYQSAEVFRTKFSEIVFDAEGSTYRKTVSIGLSKLEDGDDIKSLLKKADKTMYEAKTTGKNKVCFH